MPIRLDLNNPAFQHDWFSLPKDERVAVLNCLRKLASMDWLAIYNDHGLKWESIQSRTGKAGRLYSIRITQKMRAVVTRSDNVLEILTLHPHHDSAYR